MTNDTDKNAEDKPQNPSASPTKSAQLPARIDQDENAIDALPHIFTPGQKPPAAPVALPFDPQKPLDAIVPHPPANRVVYEKGDGNIFKRASTPQIPFFSNSKPTLLVVSGDQDELKRLSENHSLKEKFTVVTARLVHAGEEVTITPGVPFTQDYPERDVSAVQPFTPYIRGRAGWEIKTDEHLQGVLDAAKPAAMLVAHHADNPALIGSELLDKAKKMGHDVPSAVYSSSENTMPSIWGGYPCFNINQPDGAPDKIATHLAQLTKNARIASSRAWEIV